VRIAMPLDYAGDPNDAARRAVDLEHAGLDLVWVAEAYGFDAPSLMGFLAHATERVEIGAGILPIYTRTPALIAQTAAGIDALSGGRCVLGLGASGPQVIEGWHGVPYDQPIARTREIIEICRAAWRRERLVHDGPAYTIPLPPDQGTGLGKPLKMITKPVRERIPIYVAALGPANVAMTAEVADGWLPLFFIPELADRVWGSALTDGGARRSPALEPLEIVAGGLLAIGDDAARHRDLMRPMVALYVGGMGAKGRNFYNDLARRYGWEDEAATIQDLYLDGRKDEAAAAVPDALLEGVSLCGPEGYVRDRIAAMADAGVSVLNVTPVGGDPVKTVELVKSWL
jgi:F420-dependent oxidoreductase-like protein